MRLALSNVESILKKAFAAAAVVSLGGCATIIDGTSQEIMVSTNPAGANCVLERQGQPLATIAVTPGTALIKRTKHDITIRCSRDGFEEATFLNHSGLNSGAVAGNVAADFDSDGGTVIDRRFRVRCGQSIHQPSQHLDDSKDGDDAGDRRERRAGNDGTRRR